MPELDPTQQHIGPEPPAQSWEALTCPACAAPIAATALRSLAPDLAPLRGDEMAAHKRVGIVVAEASTRGDGETQHTVIRGKIEPTIKVIRSGQKLTPKIIAPDKTTR